MSLRQTIYLDNNATTPTDPRVVEVMLPYFTEKFGNASSKNHVYGWQAEEAVDMAREQVAALIGASPAEIIFTSGATESNNLAIRGALESYRNHGQHIITCTTEHKAVLDPVKNLEEKKASVSWVGVEKDGMIKQNEITGELGDATILLSVMYANNETGVIQPVKELSKMAREHDALFMTDATQAVGKITVDVNDSGIDLMSFSSHKMYGPKGVGALYIRNKDPKVRISGQIDGGGQEKGIRAGTLNVPGIVGFGIACELCRKEMEQEGSRLKTLRDQLEEGLLMIDRTHLNGNIAHRLPHVSNISFEGVDGEKLLLTLNDIAVSRGSACTSATVEPSHVLTAMGISAEHAHSSLRFGLGRFTTKEEIDYTIKRITEVIEKLRN